MSTKEAVWSEFKERTGSVWRPYEEGGVTVALGYARKERVWLVCVETEHEAHIVEAPQCTIPIVKHRASEILIEGGWPEGQGIGSSDVNVHLNEAAHYFFQLW